MKNETYIKIYNEVNLAKNNYVVSLYNRGKENNSENSINNAIITYEGLRKSLEGFNHNDKHNILLLAEEAGNCMYSFAQTGKRIYHDEGLKCLNKLSDYIYSSINIMDYEVGKF